MFKCGVGVNLSLVCHMSVFYFMFLFGSLEVVFGSLAKESPFEPYKNTKRLSF